jgi:PilZ domain-containing protein
MNDHRRKPRRNLDRVVEILDVMTESMVGRIGNLSETGMLIQAEQTLVEDALYQLRFALIDRDGSRHSFEIGVHHLWSEPAAMPGTSWIGFRFIDISPNDTLRLREWVQADATAH